MGSLAGSSACNLLAFESGLLRLGHSQSEQWSSALQPSPSIKSDEIQILQISILKKNLWTCALLPAWAPHPRPCQSLPDSQPCRRMPCPRPTRASFPPPSSPPASSVSSPCWFLFWEYPVLWDIVQYLKELRVAEKLQNPFHRFSQDYSQEADWNCLMALSIVIIHHRRNVTGLHSFSLLQLF